MQALQTRHWEFAVQGIWKGPVQETLRIYAHDPDGSLDECDFEFKLGQSYLVFARTEKGFPGRYRANVCTGTVRGEFAMRVLRIIGRPLHSFR